MGQILGAGAVRWNGYFGEREMAAVGYLMSRSGERLSTVVRRAIAAQAQRDRLDMRVDRRLAALYRRLSPYPDDEARRKRSVVPMRRKFIWLSDPELKCLGDIAVAHGLRGQAEAARLAVLVQAAVEGQDGK